MIDDIGSSTFFIRFLYMQELYAHVPTTNHPTSSSTCHNEQPDRSAYAGLKHKTNPKIQCPNMFKLYPPLSPRTPS